MDIPLLLGIIGLLAISLGVVLQNRRHEDYLYIFGGVCLEVYAISIGSLVFMVLQVVFVLAATVDLIRISRDG